MLVFTSFTVLAQNNSDAPKKKSSLPESLLNLDINSNFKVGVTDDGINFPIKAVIGSKNNGIIIGFQNCGFKPLAVLEYTPKGLENQVLEYNPDAYNFQTKYLNSHLNIPLNNNGVVKKGMALRLGYQKSIFKGLYANLSADLCRIQTSVSHEYLVSYNYDYVSSWDGTVYTYSSSVYLSELETKRTILGWRLNTGLGYTISLGDAKKFYLNTEMIYSVIDKSKSTQGKMSLMGGIGFRLGTPAKTSYDGIKVVNTVPVKR